MTKRSSSTQINTTPEGVMRDALQQRVRRLAKRLGMACYQEGLIMVVVSLSGRMIFLLCLGDEDVDMACVPREQITGLARLMDRGLEARVVWPRDWPEVRQLIISGDWRY